LPGPTSSLPGRRHHCAEVARQAGPPSSSVRACHGQHQLRNAQEWPARRGTPDSRTRITRIVDPRSSPPRPAPGDRKFSDVRTPQAHPDAAREIVDLIEEARGEPSRIGVSEPEGTATSMMVTFRNFQRIHMVGIGASYERHCRSSLRWLFRSGRTPSSPQSPSAAGSWRNIFEGHKAETSRPHVVVFLGGEAHNPEVTEAHKRKIPVIARRVLAN